MPRTAILLLVPALVLALAATPAQASLDPVAVVGPPVACTNDLLVFTNWDDGLVVQDPYNEYVAVFTPLWKSGSSTWFGIVNLVCVSMLVDCLLDDPERCDDESPDSTAGTGPEQLATCLTDAQPAETCPHQAALIEAAQTAEAAQCWVSEVLVVPGRTGAEPASATGDPCGPVVSPYGEWAQRLLDGLGILHAAAEGADAGTAAGANAGSVPQGGFSV